MVERNIARKKAVEAVDRKTVFFGALFELEDRSIVLPPYERRGNLSIRKAALSYCGKTVFSAAHT